MIATRKRRAEEGGGGGGRGGGDGNPYKAAKLVDCEGGRRHFSQFCLSLPMKEGQKPGEDRTGVDWRPEHYQRLTEHYRGGKIRLVMEK